jgi:hypothetical protein
MSLNYDTVQDLYALKARLPFSHPKRCKTCIHYAVEGKVGEQFIKGPFCAHLPDYPSQADRILARIENCEDFIKREPEKVYMRECAPMVIDIDRIA